MNTQPARRCAACGGSCAPVADGLCPACLLTGALADESDRTAPAFDAAQRIGPFRVLEEIDRGGVGIVYRAWQDDLQREVALKLLLPQRLANADTAERFRREAELMAGLDHTGILPVYATGEHAGTPYYCMKLAEGGNLAHRIAVYRGRWQAIAELAGELAGAMTYAHRHGVLHRDLKPSNVVFDAADHALLTDFGLARRVEADDTLTGIDTLIGTPRYVAPELVSHPGARPTPAADIYGLGAILYELLTGQPPFAQLQPLQLLQHAGTLRPQPPRSLDPAIPDGLQSICLRCLERRPGDRYRSTDALARALECWLHPPRRQAWSATLARHIPALPSRRRVLASALVLGGIAAAGTPLLASRLQNSTLVLPDPRTAAASVTILPAASTTPSRAQLAAVRELATRLRAVPDLRVLPAGNSTRPGHASMVGEPARRARLLGAPTQVEVDADTHGTLRVRATDALRRETIWQGDADPAHIDALATRVASALRRHQQRVLHHPLPSRTTVLELARGDALYGRLDSAANDAAIRAYQRAIAATPAFAPAHARLAATYSQRANRFGREAFWLDSAIEEAERAVRLDPSLPDAEVALGFAYYNKGWWQRAAAAYERAAALGSTGVDLELGLIHYGMGRMDDSLHAFQRILDADPENKMAMYLSAQTLFTLGATDAGARRMQAAITQEPQPGKRDLMTAETAFYRGDDAGCRRLAGALDPGLVSGGFFTAGELVRRCAERQHDWPGALALLRAHTAGRAGGIDDLGDAGLLLEEAVLLTQLGRTAEASTVLGAANRSAQAAIDSGREYPKIWLRMAAVLRLQGDVGGAYRALDAAFAHGLTINARNRDDFELLPFQNDARFAALRDASAARVAAMRKRAMDTRLADAQTGTPQLPIPTAPR